MRIPAHLAAAAALAPLVPLPAQPGAAQELEVRIRGTDGDVAFHFAVREGVEVCDHGVVSRGGRTRWSWRGDEEEQICSTGLAEAVFTVRSGAVRDVDLDPWEGAGSTPAGVRDLGRVPAPEAAGFLLSMARSGRDAVDAAKDGLFVAVLADSVEVWPDLLELARDRSLDDEVREGAVFWLGQEASDAVTADLLELAAADDEDQDLRDAAVFALSRRADDEAVPALMELARTADQAETRRSAMFWLARSEDPRVLPFFEEILLGRAGGG
ncbi:MAG TPA: HEAT repeat domain-containing protein [Longimicrobiales bacterium]|nr:HEAT repeat domain-containing protein [Longimicrobiales bacterium]